MEVATQIENSMPALPSNYLIFFHNMIALLKSVFLASLHILLMVGKLA